MKTDPLPVGLEALPAKWRKQADDAMILSREHDHIGDGGNSHAFRKEARVRREQADELEAVLSAEPRQQERPPLCVCGHDADAHGNDGHGACGEPRCRKGGCKQFTLEATEPCQQEPERCYPTSGRLLSASPIRATEPRPPAAAVDPQQEQEQAMTDTYVEDGLLIILADDAWEVWCGADGENIINAHLIGSNPSRDAAIAGAREELLELADRLGKHLPLTAPTSPRRERCSPPSHALRQPL